MTTNGQPDQCQTGEASFVTVRDATERYVVVVVMGPPGAGKSTVKFGFSRRSLTQTDWSPQAYKQSSRSKQQKSISGSGPLSGALHQDIEGGHHTTFACLSTRGPLVDKQAKVVRLQDAGCETARALLLPLLKQFQVERSVPKLKIQKELVDQNRTLPQTGAGRQLKSILKNAAKRENNNPVLRQALAQFRTPFSVRWKQFLGIYRFNEDKAFGKETVVWSSPSPNA